MTLGWLGDAGLSDASSGIRVNRGYLRRNATTASMREIARGKVVLISQKFCVRIAGRARSLAAISNHLVYLITKCLEK